MSLFHLPIFSSHRTCAVCRLPAHKLGMVVDQGSDFPEDIGAALRSYGESMWLFRSQPDVGTTRALNFYKGEHRGCPSICWFCCGARD